MPLFPWLLRLLKPPIFVVHLRDGHATPKKGHLSVAFLAECASLSKKRGVDGHLYGVWKNKAISIEFSPDIPDEHRQVFRNVWGVHRARHKR
jgi:hypothetical protein